MIIILTAVSKNFKPKQLGEILSPELLSSAGQKRFLCSSGMQQLEGVFQGKAGQRRVGAMLLLPEHGGAVLFIV